MFRTGIYATMSAIPIRRVPSGVSSFYMGSGVRISRKGELHADHVHCLYPDPRLHPPLCGGFTTNFSVLGNIAGRNEAFVLWGLMVGIYFFVCLRKIFRHMPEKPAGTWLVPLALVLLDFAVTTPYLPEMFPLKAYLHIVFAFLAAACLILCVFLTVLKLYQRDPREYRPYLWGIGIIVAVSAFLFILAGIVSSALEIFFTVSMTWMFYGLYKNMTAGDCVL